MKVRHLYFILAGIAISLSVLGIPRYIADDKSYSVQGRDENDEGLIILVCYVGENMVKPMDEICRAYERLNPGTALECYDSGTTDLDKTIRDNCNGDLFLPGSNSYTDKMKKEGLVILDKPVCKHILSVIVPVYAKVKVWQDLMKPGIRIGRGNENNCSVGRLAKRVVKKSGLAQIETNIKILSVINFQSSSFKSLLGNGESQTIDALMNWRNMSFCPKEYKDKLMIIDIPENINIIKTIPIAVLKYSKHPKAADKFARFVSSEEGKRIFRKRGFATCDE